MTAVGPGSAGVSPAWEKIKNHETDKKREAYAKACFLILYHAGETPALPGLTQLLIRGRLLVGLLLILRGLRLRHFDSENVF